MKTRLSEYLLTKELISVSIIMLVTFAVLLSSFDDKAVNATGGDSLDIPATMNTKKNVNNNQVTVLNSHSDIDPEDSLAYVVSNKGITANVGKVETTPFSKNSKIDLIMAPSGLTNEESALWLSNAKRVAMVDYIKTGRQQKIIMVDATVATITIGDSSIPEVSAVDVSRYQSWMEQSDFDMLSKLGVKAVTVKVSEGTTIQNEYAANQIKMAKAAGMVVSVYHFARFTDVSSAKAEAEYTADSMTKLGLPKSTRVFADMEASNTINRKQVASNLTTYLSTLSSLGYSNGGLYTGAKYQYSTQMIDAVGVDNTWIASYPYNPSSSSMQHTEYGAWQFSSTARITNSSSNLLDVSHDYNGLLTGTDYNQQHNFGKYVTVTRKSGSTYSDFNWTRKNNLSSMYEKTYVARYYYSNQNGATYYSLYDSTGNWQGYVNADFTKVATGQQGVPLSAGSYVTVNSKSGTVWANFSQKKMTEMSSYYQETFYVKTQYHHFSGATYYSLYDAKGKWKGYVNSRYAKVASGEQGIPLSGGDKYVTLTSKSGTVWANFSHKVMARMSNYYQKTFQVKTKYNHISGSVYYSLYDDKGKWKGYVNSCYTKTANGEQGIPLSGGNKYVTVTSKSGTVWANFTHKVMTKISTYYQKTFQVKTKYNHISGAVYYSLYNQKGEWMGYINSGYAKIAKGDQGIPLPANRYVMIKSKSGTVWANFSHKSLSKMSTYYGKRFHVKVKYNHFSGSVYYSLYDKSNKWKGYINSCYSSNVSGF